MKLTVSMIRIRVLPKCRSLSLPSVSIGIAVIKDDYNTRVEYLIGKADDAMYSVKKSGKANYAFI